MNRRLANVLVAVLITVSSVATVTPSLRAQGCLGPDNLTGTCCSLSAASIPALPAISIPGISPCYASCGPCDFPVDILETPSEK